jgi:hypothetical protein
MAKAAGELVSGIAAIVAVLYGLSRVADDILAHSHIHVDHQWWAYRVWHAWWWAIAPLCMVGIGWRYRRQPLGGGLWAVGIIWLAFIGCASCTMLFLGMFTHLSDHLGFLWGTLMSCAGILVLGLGFLAAGRLVNQVRSRLGR